MYSFQNQREVKTNMNLNILDKGIFTFHNKFNMDYYINRISPARADLSLSPISNIEFTQDTSEISDDAKVQYEYTKELEASQDTSLSQSSINTEFIKNYALKYADIRAEILKETPKNEIDKRIELLDKSYSNAVDNAAEKLSAYFQNFFDYSEKEWTYGNSSSKTDSFDKEAFKSNILSMSDSALAVVKQSFEDNSLDGLQSNIENELSSMKSGTTVESMNYTDINETYSFLKSLPQFKHHVQEYFDNGTYRPAADNWSTSDAADAINKQYALAEDFLKSGKVSSNTAKSVYNTVLENISAYHKNFAFGFQSDKFQEEINKDDSYYRLLSSQYNKYEKKLEESQGQDKMDIILIYLRMLSSYKDKLGEIKDKLKNDLDAKDKLSQNPESVSDTDAYKDISRLENFDESKRA
jgi:hypothetical protein